MIAFRSAYELYMQQLRVAFGFAAAKDISAESLLKPDSPEWRDGQRTPARRPFRSRHEASCFERPPCSYNHHHPYHLD